MRIIRSMAVLILLAPAALARAGAQELVPPVELERQIVACFDRGDYEQAAGLIEGFLERSPHDATMLYNLACAYSRLGKLDRAATALYQSVKSGFVNFDHMRSDPDLEALRTHETYRAILEAEKAVAESSVDRMLEHWRKTYGEEDYWYTRDEEHHLAYATALDETAQQEVARMLQRQADQMIESLFDAPPPYTILVAIPTLEDGDAIFNDPRTGGRYDHSRRQLVARDIGTTLRHEFFHAYHYGHMQRIGQLHPIAIQEGIASLYEQYKMGEDGSIEFLPNERMNIVKNQQRAGLLRKWKDLFALGPKDFMDRPGLHYPQVRSIFEFVAAQGKLQAWYRRYVEDFDEDATGLHAFEIVFAKPVKEIERDWRRWLLAQPKLDVIVHPGDASLGIITSPRSANDGVEIERIVWGSAAQRARLRPGDVIVSIDGRGTRSYAELATVIGEKEVGEEVEVRVRRGSRYRTVTLTLSPR